MAFRIVVWPRYLWESGKRTGETMDTSDTPEPALRPGEIELVSDDDGGVLCLGEPADVEAYISKLTSLAVQHGQQPPLSFTAATKAGAIAATGANLKVTSGTYLKLTAESEALLRKYRAMPGRNGAIRGVAQASDGTIKGLLQFKKVAMTAERTASIQLMMVTASLQASIKDVEKAVERVGEKVNELTKKVDADWKGNVVGIHNMLRDAVRSVDEHGVLTDVMWDGVASSLGDISYQVAKVREYLDLQVRGLQTDGLSTPNPKGRADRLEKLVSSNMIGEALQLLVIVEDSRYLWHRLAIERTALASPDQMNIVTATARAHLRQDIVDDQAMLARLYELLQQYGSRTDGELLRYRSGVKMGRSVAQLRDSFEAFRDARRLQLLSWQDPYQPTWGAVGKRLKQQTAKAIEGTQSGLGNVLDAGQRFGVLSERAISEAASAAGEQVREAQSAMTDALRKASDRKRKQ
jgi:hypothetical protein